MLVVKHLIVSGTLPEKKVVKDFLFSVLNALLACFDVKLKERHKVILFLVVYLWDIYVGIFSEGFC